MKIRWVLIVGALSFILVACTKILAWATAPEKIVDFPFDIGREHSFTTKIDFKTHTQHRDNSPSVGPYKIGIVDSELQNFDGATWGAIKSRKGFRKDGSIDWDQPDFIGRIVFEWTFLDGEKQTVICDNSGGTILNGIGIGVEWLPSHAKQEVSDVTIRVERVDSLLASLLKRPSIVILRGGGK